MQVPRQRWSDRRGASAPPPRPRPHSLDIHQDHRNTPARIKYPGDRYQAARTAPRHSERDRAAPQPAQMTAHSDVDHARDPDGPGNDAADVPRRDDLDPDRRKPNDFGPLRRSPDRPGSSAPDSSVPDIDDDPCNPEPVGHGWGGSAAAPRAGLRAASPAADPPATVLPRTPPGAADIVRRPWAAAAHWRGSLRPRRTDRSGRSGEPVQPAGRFRSRADRS